MSMTTELLDCHGKSVEQVAAELGDKIKLPYKRVAMNAYRRVKWMSELHAEWRVCAVCGLDERTDDATIQIHHIGRSDERFAVLPLCFSWSRNGGCHMEVSKIGLARILYAKLAIDPMGTDWEKLSRLLHRHLPSPSPAEGAVL